MLLYLMERDAAVDCCAAAKLPSSSEELRVSRVCAIRDRRRSYAKTLRAAWIPAFAGTTLMRQQAVLLLAGRDADVAVTPIAHVLARRFAIDARAALGDQPAALRSSRRQGRGRPAHRPGRSAHRPSASAAPRRDAPSSNVLRAVSAAPAAASSPWAIAVAASASAFFASLISRAAERLQPGDLVQRQVGEQAQELADVGVLRVPPDIASNRTGAAGRR